MKLNFTYWLIKNTSSYSWRSWIIIIQLTFSEMLESNKVKEHSRIILKLKKRDYPPCFEANTTQSLAHGDRKHQMYFSRVYQKLHILLSSLELGFQVTLSSFLVNGCWIQIYKFSFWRIFAMQIRVEMGKLFKGKVTS